MSTEQINHFLNHFGRKINAPLSLKEGVCALVDPQQLEVAVVELPLESDCVLFHCRIEAVSDSDSAGFLKTLLALNFEMNAMRGCWLALEGEESLRLCTQQPVAGLEAGSFTLSLEGFILQAQQVRAFIAELRQAA